MTIVDLPLGVVVDPATFVTPAQQMLDAVCQGLNELGLSENGSPRCPERQVITTGAEPAWDDCCSGLLYVSLVRVYPTNTFPEQTTDPQKCWSARLVGQYQIGVLRCAPSLKGRGQVPSAAEVSNNGLAVMEEGYATMRAIGCLMALWKPRQAAFLAQTYVGPEGGCVGSTLDVAVELRASAA